MDFHSLARKHLQTLCKKNKIPANLSNAAMADALQALQIVQGIEDLLHLQSPRFSPEPPTKTAARSPDLPRTCRGTTSTRTRSVKDPAPESSVPLTRTRAKASTARRRISKEEEQEKESSDSQPKTPAAPIGRKRETATSVLRKIEAEVEEEGEDEKENQIPVAVAGLRGYSTRRSSRLSAKRLQEPTPISIQKSRGRRKQAIKISALDEEREGSDIKLEEDSRRSDAKEDEQALPIPEEDLPKIGDFVNESGDSDLKSETGDYDGGKCDSDLPMVGDCVSEECDSDQSSHQNPAPEDATAAIDDLEPPLPAEYYHDQASNDASGQSDNLNQGSDQVPPECEESLTDGPIADIDPAEKLDSECKKIASDEDHSTNGSENLGQNMKTNSTATPAPRDADSSSSVENLNKENEDFDCQDHLVESSLLKLEFAHLSSSMKKLTLDYPQDPLVENIANSTEFSASEALNFPDSDFMGEIPAGNQFLVGSPASLRRKKISAPSPGTPLGSRSWGPSNKKGTATKTPIRSNILEDVDKENKGRESVKREMKVVAVNGGEDKEQKKLVDMSMRQLKKLFKETKQELVKRSVLQAVDDNRFTVVEGKDN